MTPLTPSRVAKAYSKLSRVSRKNTAVNEENLKRFSRLLQIKGITTKKYLTESIIHIHPHFSSIYFEKRPIEWARTDGTSACKKAIENRTPEYISNPQDFHLELSAEDDDNRIAKAGLRSVPRVNINFHSMAQ